MYLSYRLYPRMNRFLFILYGKHIYDEYPVDCERARRESEYIPSGSRGVDPQGGFQEAEAICKRATAWEGPAAVVREASMPIAESR
jgi:hypothetical protein